jgi:hypothetical protein
MMLSGLYLIRKKRSHRLAVVAMKIIKNQKNLTMMKMKISWRRNKKRKLEKKQQLIKFSELIRFKIIISIIYYVIDYRYRYVKRYIYSKYTARSYQKLQLDIWKWRNSKTQTIILDISVTIAYTL